MVWEKQGGFTWNVGKPRNKAQGGSLPRNVSTSSADEGETSVGRSVNRAPLLNTNCLTNKILRSLKEVPLGPICVLIGRKRNSLLAKY